MSELDICELCCKETAAPDVWQMVHCSHRACSACVVQWIRTVEAAGNATPLPRCPYCRVEMNQTEVTKLLGRPYQPAANLTPPPAMDVFRGDEHFSLAREVDQLLGTLRELENERELRCAQ